MDFNAKVDVNFVRVDVNCEKGRYILIQIRFSLILLNQVPLMIRAKFRPNIPSRSGEKVDFIGFAIFRIIDGRSGFSTWLRFLILEPWARLIKTNDVVT